MSGAAACLVISSLVVAVLNVGPGTGKTGGGGNDG